MRDYYRSQSKIPPEEYSYCKYCVHVCKYKNDTFETSPGMGKGVVKENGGGDEFKYDIFDTL
jgi:hypothetical protein